MANQDITTTLYNGQHKVTFKNGTHRYYIDGHPKQGVTTVMGAVLAKPGLMLWPLNMAMKHLEGITERTITLADLEEAKTAHVKKRDSGADTGTVVHGLVEQSLAVGIVDLTPYSLNKEVMAAFAGFQAWHGATKPRTLAVEQIVYSPALDFAGTFDSILEIDGKTYLCDLKTTNASREAPAGVYAENFIQLGAYLSAYEEQRDWELLNGGTKLVPIDDLLVISCKKNGKVDTLAASELGITTADCVSMWKSTLFLHNSLRDIKGKIGGKK